MSRQSKTWQIMNITEPRLKWGAVIGGRRHECPTCNIPLLTGERPGFCCGPQGSKFLDVPPLPPLPPEYDAFINDPTISKNSRILNLIFSFASLETTHTFPHLAGGPAFVAIQGKIYHRIRPSHTNSAIRWVLHDGFMAQSAPFQSLASRIPDTWISSMQHALIRINPLVTSLSNLSSLDPITCPDAQVTLVDNVGCQEMAAIISIENTTQAQIHSRNLIIHRASSNSNTRIPTVSRLWEPLVYPLLFPHGTLGWGIINSTSSVNDDLNEDSNLASTAVTTQMWHYRARLLREPRFAIFGRLANEYIIDMFSRDLESRLTYIYSNQHRIRTEDAALMGDDDLIGSENVYLPASFLGSNRWASDQIADSLAIAAAFGNPTFFITMTCNGYWPEIQSQLKPGQTFADAPIIVVRVFKRKLALFLKALKTMFPHAGKPIYCIYTVEFQKRGLPHAHILIKYPKDCVSPDDIDQVVSAEMPSDPVDAALVQQFMIHKHSQSYCQRKHPASDETTCRFNYPKKVSQHTTIDDSGRCVYRRRKSGDDMVVPHNLPLLRKFKCHINFEIAGPDKTRYALNTCSQHQNSEPVDEIEEYLKGRYLSAGEAAWRIMGFHITKKEPGVTCLPVHLQDSTTYRQYHRLNNHESNMSLLHRYFHRPEGSFQQENGTMRSFATLTYIEYFTWFRLAPYNPTKNQQPGYFLEKVNYRNSPQKHVILRDFRHVHVPRLQTIRLSQGELFYMRSILQHRAVQSFADAQTVDGIHYNTLQDAANALGLFNDIDEAAYAMMEAIENLRTPYQLRILFVHMLVNDCIMSPLKFWCEFHVHLEEDLLLANGNVQDIAESLCLANIGHLLEEHGTDLHAFGLPQADFHQSEVIHDRLKWHPKKDMLINRANTAYNQFNADQKRIYNKTLKAIILRQPLYIFINGKAGVGKTTLVKTMCDFIRGQGMIALPMATSAFAAQLYDGGRTVHSTFKVPVNENNEMLASTMKETSARAELIKLADILIWDEAPMTNKAVLACFEETCRMVMKNDLPFGGKVVVLLGDFRQTCPVVRRGSHADIIDACIKSSPLWDLFDIESLTIPIRNAEDVDYANFINMIGDGLTDSIPTHNLQAVYTDDDLINAIFPQSLLETPTTCGNRSILAPTNAQIDKYNNKIVDLLPGESRTYIAADSLQEISEAGLIPPTSQLDYIISHKPPGLPDHTLKIKIGGVYRLMRNMSIDSGLVKNVRVMITDIGHRLVTIRILQPDMIQSQNVHETDILLPRITFDTTLPSKHTLRRRQIPLMPAYASTFNGCQGLTLDKVGIDFTSPVFSHGQLYTALSRVRKREDVTIRLNTNQDSMNNVTFHDILI